MTGVLPKAQITIRARIPPCFCRLLPAMFLNVFALNVILFEMYFPFFQLPLSPFRRSKKTAYEIENCHNTAYCKPTSHSPLLAPFVRLAAILCTLAAVGAAFASFLAYETAAERRETVYPNISINLGHLLSASPPEELGDPELRLSPLNRNCIDSPCA